MFATIDRTDRVVRWAETPVGRRLILPGTVEMAHNLSLRERVVLERARDGLTLDAPSAERWKFNWRIPCR
jgi:hypothetical protein